MVDNSDIEPRTSSGTWRWITKALESTAAQLCGFGMLVTVFVYVLATR